MSFSMDTEKENNLFFFGVEIILEQGKLQR